jgi:hypothetical protein
LDAGVRPTLTSWLRDPYKALGVVAVTCAAVLMISAAAGTASVPDGSGSSTPDDETGDADAGQAALTFVAILTGADVVPPAESDGRGEARFSVNEPDSELSFTVTFEGLAHLPAGLHLHLGQPGAKGARAYDLAALAGVRAYGFESPVTGTVPLIPQHVEDLRAGNLYVDIHSGLFFASEVRGQVLGDTDAEESAPTS